MSATDLRLPNSPKPPFPKGGGRRSLTEDCIGLYGEGNKSSVSYADSSFAKGAFGDISELVFISKPVSFFHPHFSTIPFLFVFFFGEIIIIYFYQKGKPRSEL